MTKNELIIENEKLRYLNNIFINEREKLIKISGTYHGIRGLNISSNERSQYFENLDKFIYQLNNYLQPDSIASSSPV